MLVFLSDKLGLVVHSLQLTTVNKSNLLEVTEELLSAARNFTNKRVFFSYLKNLFEIGRLLLAPISGQNDQQAHDFCQVSATHQKERIDQSPFSPAFWWRNKSPMKIKISIVCFDVPDSERQWCEKMSPFLSENNNISTALPFTRQFCVLLAHILQMFFATSTLKEMSILLSREVITCFMWKS